MEAYGMCAVEVLSKPFVDELLRAIDAAIALDAAERLSPAALEDAIRLLGGDGRAFGRGELVAAAGIAPIEGQR
jgi:hypothetical protein